jgi:hypothetical protein
MGENTTMFNGSYGWCSAEILSLLRPNSPGNIKIRTQMG